MYACIYTGSLYCAPAWRWHSVVSHNGTESVISWFIVKEQRAYGRQLAGMDKLKPLLSFTQKQQTNLGFGLIALITAGSEHIFSVFAFKCPCNDWNFVYGNVCLLVPALALLILSYMLSNKTWKLFTGLCLRKSKLCRFNFAIGFCVFFFKSPRLRWSLLSAGSQWLYSEGCISSAQWLAPTWHFLDVTFATIRFLTVGQSWRSSLVMEPQFRRVREWLCCPSYAQSRRWALSRKLRKLY